MLPFVSSNVSAFAHDFRTPEVHQTSVTVERELSRLERSALVSAKWIGNQKHYRANEDAPIFEELCGLVAKTLGV